MNAIGIIAEYNPFHRGHKWQIDELRRRFGAGTGIVCAMSGDFVQRGDFAVERATEYRFLDENRFCSYFIEERKRRGWGQRKIETELKRRHVVLDDIPGYPEDFFAVDDDLARASALLAKRRVPEARGFEKLVRYLMAKGFSYHIAADAVKARLDAEKEECAV